MVRSSFDKEFMKNAELSFSKEFLLTNGKGSYTSSTLSGCNTRKYHGLFVCPQPDIDDNNHVLLSCLDEQISYNENVYSLATHKYPNTTYPAGYELIDEFFGNPVPKWVFRLDDLVLSKEILMHEGEDVLLIRYQVLESSEKVQLKLTPFVAFRNVHELIKANLIADKSVEEVVNGIKIEPYKRYAPIYLQTSAKSEFVAAPDWFYNFEYPVEQQRGYPYSEDLLTLGHFHVTLKKDDKFVVYVGLDKCNPKSLNTRFSTFFKKKPSLNTFESCIEQAARQFVLKTENETRIKAGYHWFGCWGRDTFISLPGLLLETGNPAEFIKVIDSALPDLKDGLLPNIGTGKHACYNSVDSSLWFIWALQQFHIYTGKENNLWNIYGTHIKQILYCYRHGTHFNIKMDEDGLIFAGMQGVALTWMDAIVAGEPVTPRIGKPVEINALWYNAICFSLELAMTAKDKEFFNEWEHLPALIEESFLSKFWDCNKRYFADTIGPKGTDWSIRPNQIFALSLPYSPILKENVVIAKQVLETVKDELVTERGLRTLSKNDEKYQGVCSGSQEKRDAAYHNGTIWPWLSCHFVSAWLNIYGTEGLEEIEDLLINSKSMDDNPCLYTMPEILNGNYPHMSVGAVAQAWSVAETNRMVALVSGFKKNKSIYQKELV